jgi:hypothetical protein
MLRLGRLLYRRGLAQQKQAADASGQTEQRTAAVRAEPSMFKTPIDAGSDMPIRIACSMKANRMMSEPE